MIYTKTLTAKSDVGFSSIGSAVRTDTITFNITNLTKGNTWQWFVKANTTDADIDAIAGDTGTVDQTTEPITFSLPTSDFTVGTTYYFALREFDGSDSQEVIQVAFTIAQNAVLGQGTSVLNISPLFLPNFTTAERDAYTTGSNALLIYNTTTDRVEQYNPDTDSWSPFGGGTGDVTGPGSSTDNALVRFDSTTGKLLQNGTVTQDDSGNLSSVLSAGFTATTAPSYEKGRVWYDNSTNSLSYYDHISGTSIQIGKEEILDVRNNTGSTITDGSVVYLSGAIGQTPTIALANAGSISTAQILGIATHDIANNSTGKITTYGLVNDVDTSAFSDGDLVYLSTTSGQLTTTAPVSPNFVVAVGYIVYAHATQGKILVNVGKTIANNNSLGTNQSIAPTQNAVKTYSDTTKQYKTTVTVGASGADYTDIQTAVDAITAAGGYVDLIDASYTISSTISMPDNVTLRGQWNGYFSDTTKLTASAAIDIIEFTTTSPGGLENIKIDGNSKQATSGIKFTKNALAKIKGPALHNVFVEECQTGILSESSGIASGPFDDVNWFNIRIANCDVGIDNWSVFTGWYGGSIGGCGIGVYCRDSSAGKLDHIIFSQNTVDFGLGDQAPFSYAIRDCYFEGTITAHFNRGASTTTASLGSWTFQGCTFLNQISTGNAFDFTYATGRVLFQNSRFDSSGSNSNKIATNASTIVTWISGQTSVKPAISGSGTFREFSENIQGVGTIDSTGNVTTGSMSANGGGYFGKSGATNIVSLLRQASPSNASGIITTLGGFGVKTGTSTPATSNYDLQIDTSGNVTVRNEPTTASMVATKNYVDTYSTTRFRFYSDWFATIEGGWVSANFGSGSATDINAVNAGNTEFGINQLVSGTATNGRANVRTSGASILFGGGTYYVEHRVQIPVLSDATNTFTVYAGFNDSSDDDGTDAVYFKYSHGLNSGKWLLVTNNNTTQTTADSGVTVVDSTWIKLGILVNAGGTRVDYFIDGSNVGNITTNIPTASGRNTGGSCIIKKSAGTTSRTLLVDYSDLQINLTNAR